LAKETMVTNAMPVVIHWPLVVW